MAQDATGTQDDQVRIEASVRSAALAAAKGVPLGEAILARIVAETSQPGLSVAERVSRASSMAQEFIASPKPLNVHSATPQELNASALASALSGARIGTSSSTRTLDGGKATSGKRDYQSLADADVRSLQTITSANFAGSGFASAGLNFGTFNYLRSQDRSFTGQNILNAANDAKTLGFAPTDRAAMLDHTIIDRYDPKARRTNSSLQKYQQSIEGDGDLASLHDRRKHAKTPEDRRKIDGEIAKRRAKHCEESGLDGRMKDATVPPKASAAINRRKTAIEKKAEAAYDARPAPVASAAPTERKPSQKGSDLFKRLTSPK